MSFGSVVLAIACTVTGAVIGTKVSSRYCTREKVLSELMRLCRGLAGDIGYSHEPIRTLIVKHRNRLKSLEEYLDAFVEVLDEGLDTEDGVLRERIPIGVLSDDEYDLLINMLSELGKSTAAFQQEGLNGMLEGFGVKYEEALSQARKYGKLYSKLGLLAGIAVGIMVL